MFWLYRIRHLLSWLPGVIVLLTIYQVSRQAPLKIQPHYDETTMELALAEPTPEAVAELPQPEPLPEPEPEPPPPEEPPVPVEAPPPPPPVRKPEPRKPEIKKHERVKQPTSVKKAAEVKKVAPASPVAKRPEQPAAPRPVANNGAQEKGYESALRGVLEQSKRYPTGRQAALERPKGNVEVWLEVDRSGRVLASGISKRAANMLLNRAALTSLQSMKQVRPFPAEAYSGQSSKKFSATFSYSAP